MSMASRKEVALEKRYLIIRLRNEGKSYGEISKLTDVCRSTVQTIVNKYKIFGTVLNKSRTGRAKVSEDDAMNCLFSKPPFQSIREPEVNIYAEEEKMTPRPDSSLLEEQSFTLDSVQENGVDTFHEPKVRHKKSKKIGSKRKLKKSSTIQATLDSLKTVTKAISAQHDEFSLFGEYMAMSLRTMPMRNALKCKEKLLSVIVNERLSLNSETS